MKTRNRTINTLPTMQSAKQERTFWIVVTSIMLAIFLLLIYASDKQENLIPPIAQILWVVFLLIPPLFQTIRSFLLIEQIKIFEDNFLLQYGIITRQGKEDSELGKQSYMMLYWIYFKVSTDFIFKQRVCHETYHQLKPGDQIVVQVSPENPRLCRAEIE